MASVTHDFSDWGTIQVEGANTATQVPTSQKCKTALVKAHIANTGNVYIGKAGVTASADATNATGGYPLDAGQEVRLMLGNTNEIYYIGDDANQSFTILWQI